MIDTADVLGALYVLQRAPLVPGEERVNLSFVRSETSHMIRGMRGLWAVSSDGISFADLVASAGPNAWRSIDAPTYADLTRLLDTRETWDDIPPGLENRAVELVLFPAASLLCLLWQGRARTQGISFAEFAHRIEQQVRRDAERIGHHP